MIKNKVIPFTVNEVVTVSDNDYFKIIHGEVNTPNFGDLSLNLLCSDINDDTKGKYIVNFIVAELGEELPLALCNQIQNWECICKLVDSIGRQYFLLADNFR